jgi:phage baseplate assembly protein W
MSQQQPKAFLGKGWPFPLKPVNGRLQYVKYEEDIEQAIRIILLTEQGERAMLPQFGAGVRNYVFEPNSPATHRSIEEKIRHALVDWEPRINLERVEAVADDNNPNLLLVHIDYLVRATNTFYNRVYPFYLFEGGV